MVKLTRPRSKTTVLFKPYGHSRRIFKEQNGAPECFNLTVMDWVKAMLSDKGMKNVFVRRHWYILHMLRIEYA
ncbi:hypothetical protein CEXT_293951 [Caerostris extrusa]|uniref:Uncharacterized protein n=1 Tax=Caerostris extrusa TaxID=172846 RepID=A0AAV4M911_CAEEX|nr:hypothetical protein CEXT_293951 [Caerostris extrusa]